MNQKDPSAQTFPAPEDLHGAASGMVDPDAGITGLLNGGRGGSLSTGSTGPNAGPYSGEPENACRQHRTPATRAAPAASFDR